MRSGKSFVDIAYVIPERLRAVHDKDGLNVILGVSKESVERNVLQPMREIYTSALVGTINSRNIAQVCGVPVYCLGAEKASQVAKIQGASVKYCYGDEIAKWNKEVFVMLQSRLDKPYSKFDGACNPEYPGHWLKAFIDREDIDSYVQKYTIFDNPFLDKNFVMSLCKEYSGTVYYERYIRGSWALAEGLIFPMFEEAIIETLPEVDPEEWCVSVDYGTMNAFAAILWARYGSVWIGTAEYYYSGRTEGQQKTDEDYINDLVDFCQPVKDWEYRQQVKGRLFGSYVLDVIIDPSAASFIEAANRVSMFNVVKADNNVLDGIRLTASAMKNGKIKISSRMQNWHDEAQGYVWDEKAVEDTPVKINDHCLTGDTLIVTEDGEKRIDELVGKTGRVLSYNTKTGQAEYKTFHDVRMTQKRARIFKITTEDGRIIRCTGEHPILTEAGYKRADELKNSDRIVTI